MCCNMHKIAIRLLTSAIGLNMIVFGINQIARPPKWHNYIPEWLAKLLPVSKTTALRLHGSGNVSLGLLFMTAYKLHMTGLLVAAWWAFVTPFCARVSWRAGVRDVSILSAIIAVMMLSNDSHKS